MKLISCEGLKRLKNGILKGDFSGWFQIESVCTEDVLDLGSTVAYNSEKMHVKYSLFI